MVSVSDFLTRFPMLEAVPEHAIANILAEQEIFCPARVWGNKQNMAILLRAAHVVSMEWIQTGILASSANSIASGGGATAPSGAEDDLDLTTYGRQFKALRKTIPAIGFIL